MSDPIRECKISRRTALTGGMAAMAGAFLQLNAVEKSFAATLSQASIPAVPNEYRYGHVIQEYYVRRLRDITLKRQQARANIRTPAQVMKLRDEVRQKLRACFGVWPERTPLNPRITGSVERRDYVIEKVIYESRPNYLVTANVYVPKGKSGRLPAVLGTCGHSDNGKASDKYQEFSRNLARQGYVVMIFDPPSQGERLEYPDRPGEPKIPVGVGSHNVAGNQMTLVGWNFAMWEAWDGIRGVDYLISRTDVDPKRIGVTGNSGGGTQTTYLNALDDRFAISAPNCYVTRYIHNLENEEPADIEQVLPGVLAAGLDMADFFIAQIPRPTHLGGETNDFFDVRGLRESYEDLKRMYAIVGAERNLELYVGKETHGYNKGARESVYAFFNRHLGVTAETAEPNQPVEPDATLQVTTEGQVLPLGSRIAFDFTREKAEQLALQRRKLSGKTLADELARLLTLPARTAPPDYRVMRERVIRRSPMFRDYGFVIETEAQVGASVFAMLHAVPKTPPLYYFPKAIEATLHIPHRSSLEEMLSGQISHSGEEKVLFALDVRGIGEMTARTHKDQGDDFFHPYRSDYLYAGEGLKLNEPYIGRRVHDILSALDLFQANGYQNIHLIGHGMGAITAAMAAVLHPLVKRVTLHNALLSYQELTEDPRYDWPLSAMVYGILEKLDLPDVLRELSASKKLTVVDPWSSRRRLWSKDKLSEHLKRLGLDNIEINWS